MSMQSVIEPYTKYVIDCHQNLIMSILEANYLLAVKLGSAWPWRFYIDTDILEIRNTYLATDERLRQLYSFSVRRFYLREDSVLDGINELLDQHIPLIVNVDQYYIQHHYPHIYLKKHGLHSILIQAKLEDNYYSIIDCLPVFRGVMRADNLFLAMNQVPSNELRYQIQYLEKIDERPLSDKKVFELFFSSAYLPDLPEKKTYSLRFLYTFLYDCLNNKDVYAVLKKILSGIWAWEIGRKEPFTKAYLQTFGRSFFGDNLTEVCQKMDRINNTLMLSLRKMFKASLLASAKQIETAFYAMEQACLLEENLLKDIRNMKGEYL